MSSINTVQRFTYLINWCSSEAGMVSLGNTLASYKSTERPGSRQPHHLGRSYAPESSGPQSGLHQSYQRVEAFKPSRVSDSEGVTWDQQIFILMFLTKSPVLCDRVDVRASPQSLGANLREPVP